MGFDIGLEKHLISACPARRWAASRGWTMQGYLADPGDSRFGSAPVLLRDHEIICLDRNAPFDAGHVIDCMVYCDGLDYHAATREFVEIHGDHFEKHVPFDRAYLAETAASELEAHRAVFEWVRAKTRRTERCLGSTKADAWLRNRRVLCDRVPSSLFLGNEADFTEFLILAERLNPNIADILPGNKSELVFLPYYRSFGRVASLDIYDAGTGKKLTVDLAEYSIAYFGLKDVDPRARVVRVADSPWAAAALRGENRSRYPNRQYVRIRTNPESSVPALRFDTGVYLYTSSTVPRELLVLHNYVNTVKVTDNELDLPSTSVVDRDAFLTHYVTVAYRRESRLSGWLKEFLDPLRGDEVFWDRLFIHLKRLRLGRALAEIGAWLHLDVLRMNGYLLRETEYGYELVEESTNRRRLVTNFTLKLLRRVTFPQHGDSFYDARGFVGGKSFSLTLKDELLSRPSRVATTLETAGPPHPPEVLDRKFIRHIGRLWTSRAGMIPVEAGCDMLGWNGDRSRYVGPGWTAETEAVNVSSTIYRPKTSPLEMFDTSPRTELHEKLEDGISWDAGLQDIINASVAWVGRAYMGAPLYPLETLDDETTRRVLCRLFRTLGQREILRMNPNLRALRHETDHAVTGYPVLAENYSAYQAEKSVLPLVLLMKHGEVRIEDDLDPHTIVAVGRAYAHVLARTAQALASSRATPTLEDTGDRQMDLCREGAALVRRVMGWEDWCRDRYGQVHLYRFLKIFTATTIVNAVKGDFDTQTAIINVRHTSVKRSDLVADLNAVGISADMDARNPYKIRADLPAIVNLLESRYGSGAVVIDPVREEAPQEERTAEAQ